MKNIIIWVEDRPDTVSNQILFCRETGFEVIMVATAHRFAQVLKEEKERVALIIMDIMLFTVISLENIDIKDSYTDGGYDAGWVIIDRFLRPGESSGVPDEYKDIPILILTTQRLYESDSNRLNALTNRGGAEIKYIEKNAIENLEGKGVNWANHFEIIIKKLAQKLKIGDTKNG